MPTEKKAPAKKAGSVEKEPKRILIIDDSEIVLQLAEDALRDAGYEVKPVLFPTKSDPLTLIVAGYRPDLVLADVEMPLLKGNEFVRIAKASPALSHLKIYFYSSVPAAQLADFVKSTEADGYIQKTDDLGALVRQVKEIFAA